MDEDNEDDALRRLLEILKEGQQNGKFTQIFQTDILASFILGAIEERMLKGNTSIPMENYLIELIKIGKKLCQRLRRRSVCPYH